MEGSLPTTASHRVPPQPLSLPPKRDWSSMTRTIAHYERIEKIGQGTYGQVYRARCKDTNQIVALKKLRVQNAGYGGLPPTVLREIIILKRLRHPNLVQMLEVVSSKGVEHLDQDDEDADEKQKSSKNDRFGDAREGFKGNLFLVLEYVSHDLAGLMDVAYRFSEPQVKCIFRQLLEALHFMHDNKYVHRDIKSSNILIDHHFRVKLADFGLARCIEPPILDRIHDRGNSLELTNKVITLWYKPPEILLGATRYGTAVDVWSAGCILAELILGKPLFTGKDELPLLHKIFELMGTPTPNTWEGLSDLTKIRTGEVTIASQRPAKFRDKYHSKISQPAMNLIEKLLELDPKKRLTAGRALTSRYFVAEPRAPDRPEDLGVLEIEGGHFHEFQTKKKRKEAKAVAEKAQKSIIEMGGSEKEAQEEFDTVYRGIMEKVAREGFAVKAAVDEPQTPAPTEQSKERESRRSSREGGHDSRRERSRDGRREERKREGSSREREDRKREGKDRKNRSQRHHQEDGDEERRRKKRREERDSRREGDRKMPDEAPGDLPRAQDSHHDSAGEIPEGDGPSPAARNRDAMETDPIRDSKPPQDLPDRPIEGRAPEDPMDRPRSSRRSRSGERDRSRRPDDRERRRSREDRSRDRRRRSHERDYGREYDREYDRGDRRRDRGNREWGEGERYPDRGYDRDRDPEWDRRDHGRDSYRPRGDYGPRDGPGGPPSRGPPPGPDFRRGDPGPYGPGDFREPRYYDEGRRRERDRSPRGGRW
eukprot:Nitzschia sp. Nitz4//scaffold8_size234185//221329//223783//NITZ4_001305-RA/size234185-snap-gene-0.64-mRNA-1//-1//CDS//3329559950//1039//frame0